MAEGTFRPEQRGVAGARTCPACGAAEMVPLADLGMVPALAGITFADHAAALGSTAARMELFACPTCCHVYNVAFDESLVTYGSEYDTSLDHSATFQGYAEDLARRLARDHRLTGRRIVEIGCGKGHFLVELCRAAGATGTGFDRSYNGEVRDPRVDFVTDFYDFEAPFEYDFFVMRHVLEHMVDPLVFLLALRRACGTRQVRGYIEVPDAIYDFERSPWNCPYGHVSYFSATSLARLAVRAGFGMLRLVRSFEGQYLALEVGVNVPTPDEVNVAGMGLHREREILVDFSASYRATLDRWRRQLDETGPRRCALWGAGTKGIGFLAALDADARLGAVVDLNPEKHGTYLPVTGHRVVAPEDLRQADVELVIFTNPAYRREISARLDSLGVGAELVCAH